MSSPRVDFTLTLVDGVVIAAGGYNSGSPHTITNTSEIYVPPLRRWLPAPNMNTPRASHTATLLYDGTVLVTGGLTIAGPPATLTNTAEVFGVFDP